MSNDVATFNCPQGCIERDSARPVSLVDTQGGELLCPNCQTFFDRKVLTSALEWRGMSASERLKIYSEQGDEVQSSYGLSTSQVDDLRREIARRTTGGIPHRASVAPSKASLRNLARGIDDLGAFRELIDNAVDSHIRKARRPSITVSIQLDTENGKLIVGDDAGGMSQEELRRCLQLGSQGEAHDRTIGRFGVGAKEAMYHFGSEVSVMTRDRRSDRGLFVNVPASWLETDSWEVDFSEIDDVESGTTRIEVGKLDRFTIDPHLSSSLAETYARRLMDHRLKLLLDGVEIAAPPRIKYTYPPELYPRRYNLLIDDVHVEIRIGMLDLRGMSLERGPNENRASGIFLYAQDRFFKKWDWRDEGARAFTSLKKKHGLVSHFRAEVDFTGAIERIPINANKDDVRADSILTRAGRAFDKIVSPYLDAITFLSQEAMRYVDAYTLSDPHRDAVVDAPPINLGRYYDSSTIDKSRLANLAKFKEIIAEEREAHGNAADRDAAAAVGGGLSTQHGEFVGTAADDVSQYEQSNFAVTLGEQVRTSTALMDTDGDERAETSEDGDDAVADERVLLGTCEIFALPNANAFDIVTALKSKADELELQLQFRLIGGD